MTSAPKVSVCIPIFNGEKYIRDALHSVLQQNYQDFEVVIVDNSSTDRTALLVAEFSSQVGKVRFFRNEKNIGLAGNLNRCLEYASGDYIKYLCVDDLLIPGCLERMVAGLDAHPAVSLVCGGRLSINASGHTFGQQSYSRRDAIIPGHKVISGCLFGGNFIGGPTAVMFRKADALTRFRDDLPQLMDMEMWFCLLERGSLLSIATPLCAVRSHEDQITLANIRSSKLVDDNIRIFDEYSKKPYLKASISSKIRHKVLMTYRIYRSKEFISREGRRTMLERYGFGFLYFFISIPYFIAALKRRFFARKT